MPGPKVPGRWTPFLTGSMRVAKAYNRRPIRPLRRQAEDG